DTAGLWQGESQRELLPLFCHIKLTLSPVSWAGHLHYVACVDQLLENACQTLLGYAQHIQQFRHGETRPMRHEMQHTVMGAAKTVADENLIRIGGKVAIGEENELDQREVDLLFIAQRALPRRQSRPRHP